MVQIFKIDTTEIEAHNLKEHPNLRVIGLNPKGYGTLFKVAEVRDLTMNWRGSL